MAGQIYTADFGTAQAVTIRGTVFDDENANGLREQTEAGLEGPNEPGAAGVAVFVDQNHNGALDTLELVENYTLATNISMNGMVTLELVRDRHAGGDRRSDVELDIDHTYDGDLEVFLAEPSGDAGAALQPREAAATISKSRGWTTRPWSPLPTIRPWRLTCRSTGGLGLKAGSPTSTASRRRVSGGWRSTTWLRAGAVGRVNGWSLRFTTGDYVTQTDGNGYYEFLRLPPGQHAVALDRAHNWSQTSPAMEPPRVAETFEDPTHTYVPIESGTPVGAIVPEAARDGAFGLQAGRWMMGAGDAPVVRPGDTVTVWMKTSPDGMGHGRFGFGDPDEGTVWLDIYPGGAGTGEISLWRTEGVFEKSWLLTSARRSLSPDTWYRLEMHWGQDGSILARVYSEYGFLRQSLEAFTFLRESSTLSFRAVGGTFYFDTVEVRRDPARQLVVPFRIAHHIDFGIAQDARIEGVEWYDHNGSGDPGPRPQPIGNWKAYIDMDDDWLVDTEIPPMAWTHQSMWGSEAIPDRGSLVTPGEVRGASGVILDVTVGLKIQHTYDGDLDVYLVSPSGTRVELFSDVGGAGDHFGDATNVVQLSDGAAVSIVDGVAPFLDGPYRPEGSLADFRYENPNGIWHLLVIDDARGDLGALDHWFVNLTVGDPTVLPDARGAYAFNNLPADATYLVRDKLNRTGYVRTAPVGATYSVTPGSGQVVTDCNFGWTEKGSISGTVWHDRDVDAIRDAGEEGLAGRTVFLDVDGDHVPGRRELMGGTGGSGRRAIPDNGTTTGTITLSGLPGRVLDVDVMLTIEHTYDADLDVYLVSPSGTRVELFTDVGGGGDDFYATLLDDDAPISISEGTAPFSNYPSGYRPQQALSAIHGEDPNGTWILEITDDDPGAEGELVSFEVILSCGDPIAQTETDGTYMLGDLLPSASHAIRVAPYDGWLWSQPGTGEQSAYVGADQAVVDKNFATVQPARIEGRKWHDWDADRIRETGEADLAGWSVFLDRDGNGELDSSGQNWQQNTPLPYSRDFTTSSLLQIAGATGLVTDINVCLDVTSPILYGLHAFLISPAGTRVELLSYLFGDGLIGTKLDDEAAAPITAGSGSYTGTFRPLTPLSAFDNQDPNGTWILELYEHGAASGTLDNWAIELTCGDPAATTGAGGQYAFDNLPPGTYTVCEVQQPGWVQTAPLTGMHTVGLSSDQTRSGLDFGNHQLRLSVDDISLVEGLSGSTDAVFTVRLSAASPVDVTVTAATADGTAHQGSDYVAVSRLLTFLPEQTELPVAVPVLGDGIFEADETFYLRLSGPTGAVLGDAEGEGTILNDDVPNHAPVLASIGNREVNEQGTLAFQASATDQDDPAQTLTYTLDQTAIDLGMSIDPSTGQLRWTPTESQGGTSYQATITVTDDGANPAALSDSETITITVAEVNVAPELASIGDREVNEQVALAFQPSASDQDDPAQTLTYTLDQAAIDLGMSIDPTTGQFRWTPTESQGGTRYQATITVTDDGANPAALSDSETITITVAEVNVAPVLAPIGNRVVDEQATLAFQASATIRTIRFRRSPTRWIRRRSTWE